MSDKITAENIRNIAIVAHVDHGKTTLLDGLLKAAGAVSAESQKNTERLMDSIQVEQDRGITVMAKCTSVNWKGTKINIVDTPGHADFGGEVERILDTADGAILLVDAFEGPLPQTRFVLEKSLKKGHKIILAINKVDRPDVQGDEYRRINEVIDQTFDLFCELGATDEQCQFPIFYTCARAGCIGSSSNSLAKPLVAMNKDLVLKVAIEVFTSTWPPKSLNSLTSIP